MTALTPTSVVNEATAVAVRSHTAPGSVTLEVGCGPGQYRRSVRGRYVGIDITDSPYRADLPRTPDVVADAQYLPFRDESFDVVFFAHAFYQVPDVVRAGSEAARVLRPTGCLIVADYTAATHDRLAVQESGSVTRLDPARWRELLAAPTWQNVGVAMHTPRSSVRLLLRLVPRRIGDLLLTRREGALLVTARRAG